MNDAIQKALDECSEAKAAYAVLTREAIEEKERGEIAWNSLNQTISVELTAQISKKENDPAFRSFVKASKADAIAEALGAFLALRSRDELCRCADGHCTACRLRDLAGGPE